MTDSRETNIRFMHGDMVETTLTEYSDGTKFILVSGISVPAQSLTNIGLEWEEVFEPERVNFEDISVKVIGRRIPAGKIMSLDSYETEITVTTEDYNYVYVHPGQFLEVS